MFYCIKHLNKYKEEYVGCVDEVVSEHHKFNKEIIELEKKYEMSIYYILMGVLQED